ncbi:MAG TPA: hypothetical protein VFJ58_03205 [Armatimonadota bacterium]|nr:hypothetical protein [Armatimonadota bacterium]
MKNSFYVAAAAVLSGLCLLRPVHAQNAPAAPPDQAAPAAAPAFDPAKLVPGSSLFYIHLNEDAILNWIAEMKTTTLGKDVQAMIAAQQAKNPMAKNLGMAMALTKGFAHEAGFGMMPPTDPAAKTPPEMVAVIPIVSMNNVQPEVALVTRMMAGNGQVTWKTEPEGDYTVHVATGQQKPGQTEPAYALLPDALVVGSDAQMVHNSLKLVANPVDSMASSTQLQALAPEIDQTQALWGFLNTAAYINTVSALSGGKGPNPLTLPSFKNLMAAYRGEAFSLALKPDRLEIQAALGVDPNSTLGKLAPTLQPTPLKAPDLAFEQSVAFFDIPNVPALAPVFNDVYKPIVADMQKMAGAQANNPQIGDMMNNVFDLISGIFNNSGNEIAIDVGPLTPGMTMPRALLMIQNSDKPGLQTAMDKVLNGIQALTGQKWFPTTVLDTTIQILGPAGSPLRPAFGKAGGFDILGLDEAAIKTPIYLAAGKGGGRSLSANPEYQHVTQLLGTQAIGSNFINLHDIAQFVMALAPEADIAKARQQPGSQIGFELLNDLRSIGGAYLPSTSGFKSKGIITFDPNAAAPAQ